MRGDRVRAVELPFRGIGLSRRVLDEALLRLAERYGAIVRRGEVAELVGHEADALFLATGKHDLRGVVSQASGSGGGTGRLQDLLHLAPAQQRMLAGHVEVMLFADGYAGLQLVEDGRANLCLLTSRERLQRIGGAWPALLQDLASACVHLAERLAGASPLLARPVTISRVPYGFLHRAMPGDPEGVYRLGDQVGVIDSFSG